MTKKDQRKHFGVAIGDTVYVIDSIGTEEDCPECKAKGWRPKYMIEGLEVVCARCMGSETIYTHIAEPDKFHVKEINVCIDDEDGFMVCVLNDHNTHAKWFFKRKDALDHIAKNKDDV